MKPLLSLFVFCLAGFVAEARVVQTKTIDDGGSGMFKAIAVKEAEMPDFVVYRPKDLLHAHARKGDLPLLVWANGACLNSSVGYERMLSEIASHGYVVMAVGEMEERPGSHQQSHTESSELRRGLDWILGQVAEKESDYYRMIDTSLVAAAGHSCGGAQVLANAADPRLKTLMIMNAGMGDMEMAGASRASLLQIHCPVLYVTGGESDVAYGNARKDFERIGHVPVCWANHPASGHGGTYGDKYGGDYGRVVLRWLEWQLRGQKDSSRVFFEEKPEGFHGWEMKAKNFKQHPGRVLSLKMPCKLLSGISERDYSIYLPGSYDEGSERLYPVLYLLHGGGGAHTDFERNHHLSHLLDSLIDGGVVKEMIVVMPEANQQNMMYFNSGVKGVKGVKGDTSSILHHTSSIDWQYEDYFFQELIPFVEKTYRVRGDKEGRSVAGFSMGGGAATVYGVHHPELFSLVYDISGYLRSQPLEFLKYDPSATWRQAVIDQNNPILRIEKGSRQEAEAWKTVEWRVAVGDHDFTLEGNMDLVKAFRAKDIPYSLHIDSGVHDGVWVQQCLEDLLSRVNGKSRKH